MSTSTTKNDLDKQTAKLIARIAENLPDMDGDIMQGWIDNPSGLKKFLLGLCPPEDIPLPETTSLDTVVHVDRTLHPGYPEWMNSVLRLDLAGVGPAVYDLVLVRLFLHEGQKNDQLMKGGDIYEYLTKNDCLKDCLGLHDALEIQKKGTKVFRNMFGDDNVFCWKSVVRGRNGQLLVPFVHNIDDRIEVGWRWIGKGWSANDPAGHFASLRWGL